MNKWLVQAAQNIPLTSVTIRYTMLTETLSNSNTVIIIQISSYSLSFLYCHHWLQIMDNNTMKNISRKLSKKSCPPLPPPHQFNKNPLTELSMFFWHLISTFWNLNRCIHGAFFKFTDLELKFCRSLCTEVIWGSKVTVLGISI